MTTPASEAKEGKKKIRDLGELGTEIKKALTLPTPIRLVRGTIAVGLWGTVLTDMFIVDLVGPALAMLPQLEPLLRFRALILLVVIALVLLTLRNRYLFLFVGYIAFFPLVVLGWLVPRVLIRNWAVVIAFWPAIHASFGTFRITFFVWTLALVSCFAVLLCPSPAVIATSMALLGAYLLIHYTRRARAAFSSRTGFAALTPMVRGVWRSTLEKEQEPIDAEPDSAEYKQKLGQRLVNMYMTTTMLYVVGEKLRMVIRTKKLLQHNHDPAPLIRALWCSARHWAA